MTSFKAHLLRTATSYNSVAHPNAAKNLKYIALPTLTLAYMMTRHLSIGNFSILPKTVYTDANNKLVPKPIQFD